MLKNRFLSAITSISLMLFVLTGCGRDEPPAADSLEADPHEGQIFVDNGAEGGKWVPFYEDLPVAAWDDTLFYSDGAFIAYGGEVQTTRGIDVSSHQGEIDWAEVAAAGVEFAMIRVCYRGYSEGGLYEDELARENIEGALANGLRVGVYCFSQAMNVYEAREEAELTLSIIQDYDISMPVVFDWEHIGGVEAARTDGMDYELITGCCIKFCSIIKEAGYTPMVYFYESLGYDTYDLGRLSAFDFWLADPGSRPAFYYDFAMWQYSYTASVPGIQGEVDLNLCFNTYE